MLVTALELTMADPRAQSDMIQRHRASLTAKVTVSRCRAATNASVAILASQSEPAARSACQMSISSTLQMVAHNGGTQKECDGLWRRLRAMPFDLGYVYSGTA